MKSNNLKIFTALKKCLEDILVTTYQSWNILVNISTNFKTEKKICVKKEKQSELNLKNFIYIWKGGAEGQQLSYIFKFYLELNSIPFLFRMGVDKDICAFTYTEHTICLHLQIFIHCRKFLFKILIKKLLIISLHILINNLVFTLK